MVVKQEMEKDNKKVIFWISEKKKRKRVRCWDDWGRWDYDKVVFWRNLPKDMFSMAGSRQSQTASFNSSPNTYGSCRLATPWQPTAHPSRWQPYLLCTATASYHPYIDVGSTPCRCCWCCWCWSCLCPGAAHSAPAAPHHLGGFSSTSRTCNSFNRNSHNQGN